MSTNAPDTTGDHEIRHAVIPVSELLKAKDAATRAKELGYGGLSAQSFQYWKMVAEWLEVWIEQAKSQ